MGILEDLARMSEEEEELSNASFQNQLRALTEDSTLRIQEETSQVGSSFASLGAAFRAGNLDLAAAASDNARAQIARDVTSETVQESRRLADDRLTGQRQELRRRDRIREAQRRGFTRFLDDTSAIPEDEEIRSQARGLLTEVFFDDDTQTASQRTIGTPRELSPQELRGVRAQEIAKAFDLDAETVLTRLDEEADNPNVIGDNERRREAKTLITQEKRRLAGEAQAVAQNPALAEFFDELQVASTAKQLRTDRTAEEAAAEAKQDERRLTNQLLQSFEDNGIPKTKGEIKQRVDELTQQQNVASAIARGVSNPALAEQAIDSLGFTGAGTASSRSKGLLSQAIEGVGRALANPAEFTRSVAGQAVEGSLAPNPRGIVNAAAQRIQQGAPESPADRVVADLTGRFGRSARKLMHQLLGKQSEDPQQLTPQDVQILENFLKQPGREAPTDFGVLGAFFSR